MATIVMLTVAACAPILFCLAMAYWFLPDLMD